MEPSPSKRKLRQTQFMAADAGATANISVAHISSGQALLRLAVEDRTDKAVRTADNHFSVYAIGSIVLCITALECWLNEIIEFASYGHDERLRKQAFTPITVKYYSAAKQIVKIELKRNINLDLVVALRDDLVHHLPRQIDQGGGPLPWIVELDQRGLLLKLGEPGGGLLLAHQLCSYKLAYWTWEVVTDAVARLVDVLPEVYKYEINNWKLWEKDPKIWEPTRLRDYDIATGYGPP